MKYSTFGDLRLGFRDLFENKAETASSAIAFQIYRTPLQARQEVLESLHQSVRGKPLSAELGETDGLFDASGRALFYVRKAVEELLDLDPSVRDKVSEMTDKVVPSLGVLQKSYEDEADHTATSRKVLESEADFLATFPVGPSHTLKSILAAHVEAGEKLGALLSKRADTAAAETASRTKAIIAARSVTIGLLSRFRQAVVDEVAANPALPRDLESKIFAYFDQLETNRAARRTRPETDVEEEPELPTPSV